MGYIERAFMLPKETDYMPETPPEDHPDAKPEYNDVVRAEEAAQNTDTEAQQTASTRDAGQQHLAQRAVEQAMFDPYHLQGIREWLTDWMLKKSIKS